MTSTNVVSALRSADKSIRAVLQGYRDAWNRHDMRAMAELFDDDAQWVNIVGMYWPGRAPSLPGMRRFTAILSNDEIDIADAEIRELAPSVAIAVTLLKVGAFTRPTEFLGRRATIVYRSS